MILCAYVYMCNNKMHRRIIPVGWGRLLLADAVEDASQDKKFVVLVQLANFRGFSGALMLWMIRSRP